MRQRMYLFERAYVDYRLRLRRFRLRLWGVCTAVWEWFWRGKGSTSIELLLRVFIIVIAVGGGIAYLRYEQAQGRGFSAGTLGVFIVIGVFVGLVLWGWKPAVHFLGRIVSGTTASGTILLMAIVALTLAVIIFIPYLAVLFALTTLSLLVFIPLRVAHGLWLLHRKITYHCPHDDCSYSGQPIHICPHGEQYPDLHPSFYGIFYHTCYHDDGSKARLPTMDWWGRNKLTRLCASCHRPLVFSSIGELASQPVVVMGAPDVGKSIFIRQAIRQLRTCAKLQPGTVVDIESKEQADELQFALDQLDHGRIVAKTSGDHVEAFGVAMRLSKKQRYLLYLFDSPGEHFLTVEQLSRKQVLQHLSGIILLVDPFSLPLLKEYDAPHMALLKPSTVPFQQIVDVLINGVNLMLVHSPLAQCEVPLAVVLSKADALPTETFPFLAPVKLCNGRSGNKVSHTQVRQAMKQLGAGHSIQALEHKFSFVHYFACTPLGRMPDPKDTTPFQPVGVDDPLLWLLGLDAG